jgi:glutamate formiminotransferase/formiminotetrahydrofolate cyclodeaminase
VDAEMRELAVRAAALGNTLGALVARDASAYAVVAAAYKLPAETEAQQKAKAATVDDALMHAAEVPLETVRACAAVAELALAVAERGNTNAASDAGVAALLAEAGGTGAGYNVRINVNSLTDRARGAALADEAKRLVEQTRDRARRTTEIVEKGLGG